MNQTELMRFVFLLAVLLLLLTAIVLIWTPFIIPFLWGAILVSTVWPVKSFLLRQMPRWPGTIALIMTLAVGAVLISTVIPFLVVVSQQAEDAIANLIPKLESGIPIPDHIKGLPVIGPAIEKGAAAFHSNELEIGSVLKQNKDSLMRVFSVVTRGVFGFSFTMIVCFLSMYFLFVNGEKIAEDLLTASEKIGGERFQRMLYSVRATVRAAVYGAFVTAIVQGLLAGFGFAAAGAPFAVLLGFGTALLALIPMGPPLVYIPVICYLFFSGSSGAAIGLAVWCVTVVSMADNLVRPFFIAKATEIPLLLTLFGVAGGLLAFGPIGLFIGPAILAVGQSLWREWIDECSPAAPTLV